MYFSSAIPTYSNVSLNHVYQLTVADTYLFITMVIGLFTISMLHIMSVNDCTCVQKYNATKTSQVIYITCIMVIQFRLSNGPFLLMRENEHPQI